MQLGSLIVRKIKAKDSDFVLLLGYGEYRARLDVGRLVVREGWQVKATKIRVWKNLKYGIYSPTREIFMREWTQ